MTRARIDAIRDRPIILQLPIPNGDQKVAISGTQRTVTNIAVMPARIVAFEFSSRPVGQARGTSLSQALTIR